MPLCGDRWLARIIDSIADFASENLSDAPSFMTRRGKYDPLSYFLPEPYEIVEGVRPLSSLFRKLPK